MKTVLRRCLHRSHLLVEMVDHWRLDELRSEFTQGLEQWLEECVQLAQLLCRTWSAMWQALAETVHDIHSPGALFQNALDRTKQVYGQVDSWLATPPNGARPEGEAAFRVAQKELAEVEKEFKEKWPRFNPERAAQATDDFLSGNYHTIEELIDAAESGRWPIHQ